MENNEDLCAAATAAAAAAAPVKATDRLMITQIVLENFKSYAGRKVVGPFHKKFSAIVGPNGSGKSNVIDSLLFVFGRRAKKLRLSKVSQVIHSSAEHPNCKFARVSVYFQNIVDTSEDDDGYDVVPGSEFVVTRECFKNNSSNYLMNGKSITFTECGALLRKKGIDLDNNRFLILQGEVEQISLMKPKAQTKHDVGMLEYLEDIIGSNKFVDYIEQAAVKVSDLEEDRMSNLKKVLATEKARNDLKPAKTEAEEFLQVEQKLVAMQGLQAQLMEDEAAKNVSEAEAQLKAMDEKHNHETEKLTKLEDEMKLTKKEFEKNSKEHAAINESVQDCRKEFSAFERKDVKYREDVKHAKTKEKKAKADYKKFTKKAEEMEKREAELEESIPGLVEMVEKYKKELPVAEQLLEVEYERVKAGLSAAKTDAEEALAPVQALRDDAKALLSTRQTELDLCLSTAQKLDQELTEATEELNGLGQKEQTLKTKAQEASSEFTRGTSRMKEIKVELESMATKEQRVKVQLRSARTAAEETRHAQKQARSGGAMITSLMNETRPGGALANAGLYGRLGDLGAIDKKYDVAVSTAAGALQFLVVKSTSGAQQCIQFLRERGLGRATFICLEEIAHLKKKMDLPVKAPEGVSRLFDLVKPKSEAIRPAFFYALQNTLVATDLDQATRIAYSSGSGRAKFRVVTLKGGLIDMSGTMSGGGKPRKGAMGSAVVDRDAPRRMAEQQRCVDVLTKELATLQNSIKELTLELRMLEKSTRAAQTSSKKLQMECKDIPSQRKVLQKRVKELRRQQEESAADQSERDAHLANLKSEVAKLMKDFKKHDAAAVKLQANVDKAEANIMNAGGVQLQDAKDKVSSVTDQIKAATKAVAKAKVDAKAAAKKKVTSESAAKKASLEQTKQRSHIEKIRAALNEMYVFISTSNLFFHTKVCT